MNPDQDPGWNRADRKSHRRRRCHEEDGGPDRPKLLIIQPLTPEREPAGRTLVAVAPSAPASAKKLFRPRQGG